MYLFHLEVRSQRKKGLYKVGDIGIILRFPGLYFMTNEYLAYQMFKELRLPPNNSIPVSILMTAQIWVQKGSSAGWVKKSKWRLPFLTAWLQFELHYRCLQVKE